MTRERPGRQNPAAEPVLIVGAGPAGLAAAAELGRLGIPAEIIEKSDAVAQSWRTRYDALRMNTCRWNSMLRLEDRFEKDTPFFPVRDHAVRYLESFAERHHVKVRFGVRVDRIDPCDDGWELTTSAGPIRARQVLVALGHQHTPWLPAWPGHEQFPGRILHSFDYRNPGEFRNRDVLVVGGGCSGLDIARDLAQGGARRVRVAVRTQPNLLRKMSVVLPSDLLAAGLYRLPAKIANLVIRTVQRLTIGDLSQWGLTRPTEGVFTRLHANGTPPVIVGGDVIAAIRAERFEIVPGVASVTGDGVRLTDGTVLQPDAIVAATGYTSGLEPIAGHLGVLGDDGLPLECRGIAVAPGLRFVGYAPCMGVIGRDARRVVRALYRELTGQETATPETATPEPVRREPVAPEPVSLRPLELADTAWAEAELPERELASTGPQSIIS
jgi:glycine/D-amino acid oxidase-like deaminating enzyme